MATVYTNIHGQEASPPAPADFGKPSASQLVFHAQLRAQGKQVRFMHPNIVRAGREGISSTAQCQAPVNRGRKNLVVSHCTRPATCVIVENKPRPDGAIGGMALCDLCYKHVLQSQGPNYAKMTTLVKS